MAKYKDVARKALAKGAVAGAIGIAALGGLEDKALADMKTNTFSWTHSESATHYIMQRQENFGRWTLVDGDIQRSNVCDVDGHCIYSVTQDLTPGSTYGYRLAAANESGQSEFTDPPVEYVHAVAPDTQAPIIASIDSLICTNDSDYNLSISVSDDSRFNLFVNGISYLDQTSGSVNYTYTQSWQGGSNPVNIIATDVAGNSSNKSLEVFVDNEAPVATFGSPVIASDGSYSIVANLEDNCGAASVWTKSGLAKDQIYGVSIPDSAGNFLDTQIKIVGGIGSERLVVGDDFDAPSVVFFEYDKNLNDVSIGFNEEISNAQVSANGNDQYFEYVAPNEIRVFPNQKDVIENVKLNGSVVFTGRASDVAGNSDGFVRSVDNVRSGLERVLADGEAVWTKSNSTVASPFVSVDCGDSYEGPCSYFVDLSGIDGSVAFDLPLTEGYNVDDFHDVRMHFKAVEGEEMPTRVFYGKSGDGYYKTLLEDVSIDNNGWTLARAVNSEAVLEGEGQTGQVDGLRLRVYSNGANSGVWFDGVALANPILFYDAKAQTQASVDGDFKETYGDSAVLTDKGIEFNTNFPVKAYAKWTNGNFIQNLSGVDEIYVGVAESTGDAKFYLGDGAGYLRMDSTLSLNLETYGPEKTSLIFSFEDCEIEGYPSIFETGDVSSFIFRSQQGDGEVSSKDTLTGIGSADDFLIDN